MTTKPASAGFLSEPGARSPGWGDPSRLEPKTKDSMRTELLCALVARVDLDSCVPDPEVLA